MEGTYGGSTDQLGTFTYNSDSSITVLPNQTSTRAGIITLYQVFEDTLLNDIVEKTLTASVLTTDGLFSANITIPSSGNISTAEIQVKDGTNILFRWNGTAKSFGLVIYGIAGAETTPSLTVNAIKLESGSVSTLALDIAPNTDIERLKCQGYLEVLDAPVQYMPVGSGYIYTSTIASIFLQLPVPLKTTPQISYTGSWKLLTGTGASYPVTDITVSSTSSTRFINLNAKGTGFTAGPACSLYADTAGAKIILTSEL